MAVPRYGPYILAPPLTSCEPAYLVFGQGTPPYSIAVAGTGDDAFSPLETLPTQSADPGVVKWHCDFNAGANLTFYLTDASGQHAYSVFRVVQPGAVAQCPRGQPKKQSPAGPIAGGVVGGLVVLLALLAGGLWYRRRARRRVRMEEAAARGAAIAASAQLAIPIRSESVKDNDDEDTPMTEGPAGVVRAGTFNLGAVRFTEDSLDHLRAIDRPPAYDVPPPCTPPLASGETPAAPVTSAATPAHSTSPLGRVRSAASASARQDEIDELPR